MHENDDALDGIAVHFRDGDVTFERFKYNPNVYNYAVLGVAEEYLRRGLELPVEIRKQAERAIERELQLEALFQWVDAVARKAALKQFERALNGLEPPVMPPNGAKDFN